jgi:hypothetical protein
MERDWIREEWESLIPHIEDDIRCHNFEIGEQAMFEIGEKVRFEGQGMLFGRKGIISSQEWQDQQMVDLERFGSIALPVYELVLIPELVCPVCSVVYHADEVCECEMQGLEIPIGHEYCWFHSPGRWDCKECFIQGNLAAFFASVGEYGMLYQVWVELESVPSYAERYIKREA